jgi:hypothetical protein
LLSVEARFTLVFLRWVVLGVGSLVTSPLPFSQLLMIIGAVHDPVLVDTALGLKTCAVHPTIRKQKAQLR